ncbi:MAG TPA: siderophore-interacting protein, partial [Acidimicrobiales bacterium]|nr:siderophore-interacting protein [Acidimicrobiales bacterium]
MPEPIPTRRPVPDELFGGRLRGAYLLDLEVVAAERIAPHVRSITVASSDLVGFAYTPGQDLMIAFPDAGAAVRRRYTVRRADGAAGTADLEFELHAGGGAAARWAAAARVGEHLDGIGPRGTIGTHPGADHHLFVADDSAMPAAFAMIEALGPGSRATAVLVTAHGAESRPGPASTVPSTLTWVDEHEVTDVLAGLDLATSKLAAHV